MKTWLLPKATIFLETGASDILGEVGQSALRVDG